MDDNFRSIVSAVKWGRNVYDSIAKFLQFQLTVNIVAISTAVIGAVVLEESSLTAIQLLWVNLIMDTFASLALATDTPTEAMLKRKPYPRTKPLISERMMKHMVGQSIFQLAVILTMTFAGDKIFGIESGRKYDRPAGATGPTVHYTMIFNTFVFLQLFNEINARRIHDELNVFEGILTNHIYLGISVLQLVLQVLIVQFGSLVFSCTPLTGSQWAICVAIGAVSLPVGLVLRCIRLPASFTMCQETTVVEKVASPRTKALWRRSLKRLQVQIRVIKAFQTSLASTKALLN
ncbi:hypothetical protein H310_02245 [Aphanomyces invadans]|uniref:P-type Ca(2+) transporter n=1 Tax=Aphanomyces invadans TaxID=157072 RepID=A0A024UPP5_9STRA|nr:hypothetical protein H310_02245 [Aphanomyces invadans]ETW07817.1 hypothetical protein H310_02245 [Aphanomyces invadans]|eukprot:XP_008863910.1 hypothetical protein H310_02245 [Aphanomyces invadans]